MRGAVTEGQDIAHRDWDEDLALGVIGAAGADHQEGGALQ